MMGALLRVLLIPPILLLISPSPSHPIIGSGTLAWAVLLVALLGFSNGYFGSLPMIVFSRKVKNPQHLELAGESVPEPAVDLLLSSPRNNHDPGLADWTNDGLCLGLCSHSPHLNCPLFSLLQQCH